MIEVRPKGEYDSDEDIDLPNVSEVNLDAEREREFKEISENATLDDIKEIADILGVAYQVNFLSLFSFGECTQLGSWVHYPKENNESRKHVFQVTKGKFF